MTDSVDRVRLDRAGQLLAAGHHVEAERIVRDVLASDPESSETLLMLARALLGQDRFSEAMDVAWEACRLDPDDAHALLVLSRAAAQAGQGRYAIEMAERAVSLAPHDPGTHYTLGYALLTGSNRALSALQAADRASRLAPDWSDVHNLRGMCLAEMGDTQGARAAYEHALSLEPHHALAMSNMAGLDIRRNPLSAARRLTAAAGLDPQEELIRANMGVAAHNFVLQLMWLVVIGGLVEAGVLFAGDSRLARTSVVALLGLLVLIAGGYFIAQLPRGYRRSPMTLIRSMGGTRVGVRLLYLGFVAAFTCAVAFGDEDTAKLAAGRLLLFAVIGGVVALVRQSRRTP